VTGQVDHDLLDRLAAALAGGTGRAAARPGDSGSPVSPVSPVAPAAADRAEGPRAAARRERAGSAARRLLLQWAADVLSGPDGLAAYLRTGLPEHLVASVSLPLDVGASTDTIPVHLRRAVARRDRRCRFPGCDQPVAACQVHHIVPRSRGGPTKLGNLLNLCSFHHLVAIHRWGWQIRLHPDGTVTAVSPDGTRHLHSHGPPGAAA
jgi:HNH endonuclease